MSNQQNIWESGNGDWTTPTSWSNGHVPTSVEDALIPVATVYSPTSQTVGSIATDGVGTLYIDGASTFTALAGTALNLLDTSHLASGNQHDITVAVDSNFVIGSIFTNSGTLLVGFGSSPTSAQQANLKLENLTELNGSGTIDLGASNTDQLGNIVNATNNGGVDNINNTIQGSGTIALTTFQNGAGAKVVANNGKPYQEFEGTLQVYATSNWTNAGTYTAASKNTLDLGEDGASTTLNNSGSIVLDANSYLEISGTFDLSGNGAVTSAGEDVQITEENSASVFDNASTIKANQPGTYVGIYLTFDNTGTVLADSPGARVLINTEGTITDNEGGLFEASNGGSLEIGAIDSIVDTGGTTASGQPGGGTIEAANFGNVEISEPVIPGGSGSNYQSGQILISGFGTVSIFGGTNISTPINFSGAGGLLQSSDLSDTIGGLITMVAGDFLDVSVLTFTGTSANWVENGGGTAGTLTVTNGSQVVNFNIDGSFSNSSFKLLSDGLGGTEIGLSNTGPPDGSSAVIVMSNDVNATMFDGLNDYEIYDVGGDAIQAAYSLGQIAPSWSFLGLGTLQAGDSSDMLFRDGTNFEAYYVSGNTITSSALVGAVGTNFNFAGLGNFDGLSSLSELLLRNSNSGAFELYRVEGSGVLGGSAVAAVGNNLQVSGFGYFSESGTEQMVMEQANVAPGANAYWLYTYNSAANSYGSAGPSGTIGSNLTVVGVADLLGNGSSELIMEQANVAPGTNAYWAYTFNPANNTFDAVGNKALGTVGSNFHVVSFGSLGSAGQDEMLMQDANGDFEVYQYNASLNAFVGNSMGTVGAPWVVDGIAASTAAGGASGASTTQLVQAMASMGGGATVSATASPTIGTEPSQQTFLTASPRA